MRPLEEIGRECGTDKIITHKYHSNYERYFESSRQMPLVILEIGVAQGNSIRMWREYFPNGKIFGVDNNPDCAGEGIFIGSQADNAFMDSVLAQIGTPDIIIDDGSHYGPYSIQTFIYLFGKVRSGGMYVVEDTHCFYDATYGEAPPWGSGMSEVWKFFSGLTIDVDVAGRAYCGDQQAAIDHPTETPPVPTFSRLLGAMHIHPSLWFFERK